MIKVTLNMRFSKLSGYLSKVLSSLVIDKKKNLLIFSIIMIGFLLRIYNLTFQSLWLDEITSIGMSNVSPLNMVGKHNYNIFTLINAWDQGNPPGYYVFLHFLIPFGQNDFFVRFPSVIFGVLTIFLIYKMGKLLFGQKEGLISAFLLAISSFHIWYSQTARMYSMLTFLSLLSFYLYYKFIEKNNYKYLVGFIFTTLIAIYIHYYAIFILIVETLFLLPQIFNIRYFNKTLDKRNLKKLISCILIVWIISIPILLNMYSGFSAKNASSNAISSSKSLSHFISNVIGPFTVSFGVSISTFPIFLIAYTAVFIHILAIFMLILNWKKNFSQIFILGLWVVIPTLVIYFTFFSPRYILFVLPFYLIAVSKGITIMGTKFYKRDDWRKIIGRFRRLTPMKAPILIIIILTILFVPNLIVTSIYYTVPLKENWRSAGEYLNSNSATDDYILISPQYTEKCLLYYYEETSSTSVISINNISEIKQISNNQNKVWFVTNIHTNWEIENYIISNFTLAKELKHVAIYVNNP